jgi:predicted Zn-dependent protease
METKILNTLKSLYPWVGLRFVYTKSHSLTSEDGKSKTPETEFQRGVQIEVFSSDLNHCAYTTTSCLDLDHLITITKKAYQQAELMKTLGLHPTPPYKTRPFNKGSYNTQTLKSPDSLSQKDYLHTLNKITETMKKRDLIIKSLGVLKRTEQENLYLTSEGTEIHQQFYFWEQSYFCLAQEGSETQKRSFSGPYSLCYQGGAEQFEEHQLLDKAQETASQAVELVRAQNCPSGLTNLVLAPDQMLLQIHESIGHPLELDRILGDERNYAGSSFVTLKDFGHLQYGSPLLNVVFDPTPKDGFASYQYDDSGCKADKTYLIKEGLLLRPLGGLESQLRCGLPGVANFRSYSWNRAPIDRMANLDIEPGSSSFKDMISSIESGLYMESNTSWSIDDTRNKFQFGCEYGRQIEKGRLTKIVKNPNYRGECLPFWHHLKQVGNTHTVQRFGSPYCGKGEPSQVIRVSHSSPVCHFEQTEVFGGA